MATQSDSNYSFETSLPPYLEAPDEKRRQADQIFSLICSGANNLLKLAELTGLPQSTVAGRCNDLKTEGRIEYNGFVVYKDRKRKRIAQVQKFAAMVQKEIFF